MTNEQNYAKCKTAIFLMSAIKLQDFVRLLFQHKILNFFFKNETKSSKVDFSGLQCKGNSLDPRHASLTVRLRIYFNRLFRRCSRYSCQKITFSPDKQLK